jgi:hypothetical protein
MYTRGDKPPPNPTMCGPAGIDMKQRLARPDIKIWRLPDLGDVELLRVAAFTQALPKQFHEEFVIGGMEQGAHEVYYRGTTYSASPGSLLLSQPGEITSCGPSEGTGRTFRALHGPSSLLQNTALAITGRPTSMPFFPLPVIPGAALNSRFLKFHKTLETPTSLLERSSLQCLMHELQADGSST